MAQYKLVYFNIRGLGEPIRYALAYAEKDFEDYRFEIDSEEWPKLKEEVPFGQVPVLEIDDKKINQSIAITRYLGQEAGIGGENNWENLQIDVVVESVNDFRVEFSKARYEPDPELNEKKMTAFIEEKTPYFMSRFEKIIGDNDGYVANKKLSWGDLYVVAVFEIMIGLQIFNLDNYPNCKALVEKVHSIPTIKAWVEKRPQTEI